MHVTPIEAYDFSSDFPKWLTRFERYRVLSGLLTKSPEEQVCALLYSMGPQAEDIFDSFGLSPDDAKIYTTVVDRFKSYFVPKANVIYERAVFNRRTQQVGEAVETFITDLHKLSQRCNYGPLRDELIRDQIVIGVLDRELSEMLQLDGDLTLATATTKVKQYETVKRQQETLFRPNQAVEETSIDQVRFDRQTNRNPGHSRTNRFSRSRHESCYWCGYNVSHTRADCPAKNAKCLNCGKPGHFKVVCKQKMVKNVNNNSERTEDNSVLQVDVPIPKDNYDEWEITIKVNGVDVNFQIDSGADVTVLPSTLLKKGFENLRPSNQPLFAAGHTKLNVVGCKEVTLEYDNQIHTQTVYFISGLSRALLGKPAIRTLGLFQRIHEIGFSKQIPWKKLYADSFDKLGSIDGEYKIELNDDAKPYAITTPRTISIPLRPQIESELNRMVAEGVIEPVDYATDWCSPMVVVPKKNNTVRICVDLTRLNDNIKRQTHPLPRIDQELGLISGAQIFSKLDCVSGFWQIKLSEDSKDLTTFITPFGRYRYCRLPFGIKSAPEFFQKKLSSILVGLRNVIVHMDDILVWGTNISDHNICLQQVMERLRQHGVTLNGEKSVFYQTSVDYLGHTISPHGIKPTKERIEAILKLDVPRNQKELRSYLGVIGFILKYIPCSHDLLKPMYDLLKGDSEWFWGPDQQKSLENLQCVLKKDNTLALYDPNKETILTCDASTKGLGAVLSQIQSNGEVRPVYFCSRTLAGAEQHYANIEREALAITWACTRLEEFILGKDITIETDHKPLLQLLQTTQISELTPRIQRFRLRLMRYNYKLVYVPGKHLLCADFLSRNPIKSDTNHELTEDTRVYVKLLIQTIPTTDENLKNLQRAQENDILLERLREKISSEWNSIDANDPLLPYFHVRHEISFCDGLLMRGSRIIVPQALKNDMLHKCHKGHLGMNKAKLRAQNAVWWPNMLRDIEDFIKNCPVCVRFANNPHEPLLPTELPDRPWQIVSCDLFKQNNRWYLVASDLYSRYFELAPLNNCTSNEIINKLKACFSRYGIPEVLRADSAAQFLTPEFRKFSDQYSIHVNVSSPYHHQGNGAAEACVKIAKTLMNKNETEDSSLAMLCYRNTPIPGLHKSPAELMFGRRLRDVLPTHGMNLKHNSHDDASFRIRDQQRKSKYKENYDRRHGVRELPKLNIGDKVWITDLKRNGIVEGTAGVRSYWIRVGPRVLRRNRYSLKPLPNVQKSDGNCSNPIRSRVFRNSLFWRSSPTQSGQDRHEEVLEYEGSEIDETSDIEEETLENDTSEMSKTGYSSSTSQEPNLPRTSRYGRPLRAPDRYSPSF
ncbi:hypothetical protein M8J77_016303 [Diaphorina citri]|nr:hypothetical protein M8J77_016303 [Diaphorina citri]